MTEQVAPGAHGHDEGARPLPTALHTKRFLLLVSSASSAAALILFVSWASIHGTTAFFSPLLWATVAAFWASFITLLYLFTIGEFERAVKAHGAAQVVGVKILWLPLGTARTVGASMEFGVATTDEDLPPAFSIFLNVNFLWAAYVTGVRASWECKESGVLLLTPNASRFLGGATEESLGLPSAELAAIKAFLARPGEPHGMPDWGAPAGPRARAALVEVAATDWLLGPEQPFVALEAFSGRIEKFWPPIAQQLADLDVEASLDLLRVVRAFDRDALDARAARLTSSPSSPSSPRS